MLDERLVERIREYVQDVSSRRLVERDTGGEVALLYCTSMSMPLKSVEKVSIWI